VATAASFPAAPRTHEVVLGENLLIPFKLLPGDIARVMVVDQHAPFVDRFLVANSLLRPAVHNRGPGFRPAKGVCTRKNRIGQNPKNRMVHRRSPLDV
jgi:hypothetical protein